MAAGTMGWERKLEGRYCAVSQQDTSTKWSTGHSQGGSASAPGARHGSVSVNQNLPESTAEAACSRPTIRSCLGEQTCSVRFYIARATPKPGL